MYKKILDFGGLIISEYPPDTKCKSNYFLERNRIISGLSLGVLVIEAVHRSGTSVTSKLAVSQEKYIFTLPHELWSSHGVGTNRLLKSGAILVCDTNDILQEIDCLKPLIPKISKIKKIDLSSFDTDYNLFQTSNTSGISKHSTYSKPPLTSSKKNMSSSNPKNTLLPNHYNHENLSNSQSNNQIIESNFQKKKLKNYKLNYLYDLISDKPISINELCKKTSKSISLISNDLFLLELKGYIKKVAGGYICI